jgi:hypothetical protein
MRHLALPVRHPDYVSVKCRDPDGYVVETAWEPHLK